ncbi:MAG TPA: peptidase M23 [Vagococcus sp.]|uniref:Cell wall-binding protein n=1 Tax=Vagococcus fluvialis bH819 TaxID=1255619 RepID=A0A1X6WMT2_9ENTE|nr:Cell wall-binding protein [Vagococcus fluvialis bH819]HCM89546.1 peptidase M23 [Vagococcus sp.]
MKVKGLSVMLLSVVALSVSPVMSLAASNEEAVKKESTVISSKIDKALESVNVKYQEVETLKTEVSEAEVTIKETEKNIEKTEASITKRTEVMAGRMQNIQSNGSSFNLVDALLSSGNISDFFNRAYAMTVLQGAEKSKVDSLAEDKEKLDELKTSLEENKTTLTEKQSSMEQEASTLEKDVSSLKNELSNNQAALEKLSNERVVKEAQAKKAAVEVANRKEVEAKSQVHVAKEKTSVSSSEVKETTTSESTEESVDVTPPTAPEQPAQPSTGGQSMQMEATGYSYTQPGLSYFTATGIDLRKNSRVIAVDPNTIPLGSVVEVSGYGIAVAGDTGGDIKGNRIDLHYNTIEECRQFGRRTVSVTVK